MYVDADKDGYLGEDESEALAVKLSKCVPLDKARAAVHAMAKLAAEDGKVSREGRRPLISLVKVNSFWPPFKPVCACHT